MWKNADSQTIDYFNKEQLYSNINESKKEILYFHTTHYIWVHPYTELRHVNTVLQLEAIKTAYKAGPSLLAFYSIYRY